MGGERETVAQGKAKAQVGDSFTAGNLRIHESGGEVHFHEDAKKLKAAVPVRAWYPGFEKLINTNQEFVYVDPVNQTVLRVITVLTQDAFDVEASLAPVKVGDMAAKLVKFTFNK